MDRKRYFKVTTSRGSHYAMVERYSDLLHKIHFGGQKKCIVMSIYLDKFSHPNLDAYSHHEKCNVSGDLLHGKGTVHMLRTAIRFAHALFPEIHYMPFELIDLSYIPCAHGYELSLPHYYIAYHGKTWYEAKFKATPAQGSETYRDAVHAFEPILQQPLSLSFSSFATTYHVPPPLRHVLEPLYTKASSMKDFLNTLKTYEGNIYRTWLERFVEEHVPGLRGKSWLLPAPSSTKLTFTPLPELPRDMFTYQKGGGDVQKGEMAPFVLGLRQCR